MSELNNYDDRPERELPRYEEIEELIQEFAELNEAYSYFIIPSILKDYITSHNGERPAKIAHFIQTLLTHWRGDRLEAKPMLSRDVEKLYSVRLWLNMTAYLKDLGFLAASDKYSVSKYPKQYSLSSEIRSDRLELIKLRCPRFKTKLADAKKERAKDYNEIERAVERTLTKVTLDFDDVPSIVARMVKDAQTPNQVIHALRQCAKILCGDMRGIKRSRASGRMFTVVTNTSKYIRPFLKVDGKPVAEVDLSNSQPFFMSLLFRDIPNLLNSTARGSFYEDVNKHTTKQRSRTELKVSVLALIYRWRKNGCAYWLEDGFKDLDVLRAMELAFHGINNRIDDYRDAHGFNALSLRMQRNESEIFIERVLPQLQARGIDALSIHDSFMCKVENVEEVRNLILEEIQRKYQVQPRMKVA